MESQGLVRGHRHSNGLDAILDIEVKRLSALGRFVSPQLEGREARKTKFLLMCPEEQATTHYQYVVSLSSHVCPFGNGHFSLKGQSIVGRFLYICSKYPLKSRNSIPRVIRFV